MRRLWLVVLKEYQAMHSFTQWKSSTPSLLGHTCPADVPTAPKEASERQQFPAMNSLDVTSKDELLLYKHIPQTPKRGSGQEDPGVEMTFTFSSRGKAGATCVINFNHRASPSTLQVRHCVNSVVCIGPERLKGILKPYVADIAINLWGRDLLQQWNTQINIPPVLDTNYVQSLDSRKDLCQRKETCIRIDTFSVIPAPVATVKQNRWYCSEYFL
ncbi:putative HERV-K-8p23.1 provirus ancestral Pro protein [Cricetulus griseus]|nr:putative HERV-K-8p23.1 provirus ancestral Pro protein [Cricetulus griseus]